MALFYVTGAPGSGKTTLQKELETRGLTTRDIDNSNLGGPHNKSSGDRVTIPPASERTSEWFEAHEWRVYPDAFARLKLEAEDKDIILCGVAAADDEILHVFDKILYLRLDDDVLRSRLASRIDNDYGKNDFELEEIIQRKHGLDLKYDLQDVINIDASGSIDDVANRIIANTRL